MACVLNGSAAAEEAGKSASPKKQGKTARNLQAGERVELFNLANDPYERQNLAGEQPAKLKALRERYDNLARQAVAPPNKPASPGFKAPKVWGEPETSSGSN